MALIVHRPVEGNDAVRLLHLVPGERARIGRECRIGTSIVFGVDVEVDGFVENRTIAAVKAKHDQGRRRSPAHCPVLCTLLSAAPEIDSKPILGSVQPLSAASSSTRSSCASLGVTPACHWM